ncbi:MAG: type II toxin-antitoxin system PemK/MazF family toxin [Sulfurospirillum sp.]
MVGNIHYILMPYSDFTNTKGRPVLVFQIIGKNDVLILPLTTNMKRDGIVITNLDIDDGNLKKDSVIIIPKLTAVDRSLIKNSRFIASLKKDCFIKIKNMLCKKLSCLE